MYEIDAAQVEEATGFAQPRAIKGAWEVGSDGRVTRRYKANPNYKPVD